MAGETELDDLLAAAGRSRMTPSDALMARVLADAEAMQPPVPSALPERSVPRPAGFWQRLTEAFGGTGALAGVGTAAVAGLAFGLMQPSTLSVVTGGYMTIEDTADTAADTADEALFPDMTLFLTEDQG